MKAMRYLWLRYALMGLMLLGFGVSATAQKSASERITARKVFENLQSPALELLKKSSRLDMLDYWDADSVYRVKNALGAFSSLQTVTPDYLKVSITPVSTLEIKILPVKNETVVMTIYTTGDDSQARDSQLNFYTDTLWPMESKHFFVTPDLKNFLDIPKGSVTSLKELREMVPFPTVEYSASPDDNTLKARLTVDKYMNTDDYNILKLFLKPEIQAQWKGKYKFGKN